MQRPLERMLKQAETSLSLSIPYITFHFLLPPEVASSFRCKLSFRTSWLVEAGDVKKANKENSSKLDDKAEAKAEDRIEFDLTEFGEQLRA